jgi:hypothetical protein
MIILKLVLRKSDRRAWPGSALDSFELGNGHSGYTGGGGDDHFSNYYLLSALCRLITSTVTLRVVEGEENGRRCLGIKLSDSVTQRHYYRDLIFQAGGWTQA